MMICEICGKVADRYPNAIVTHGHYYHVGCMADKFQQLKQGHAKLVHRLSMQGAWGPWCDDWKGSFDDKHWGEKWLEADPEKTEN